MPRRPGTARRAVEQLSPDAILTTNRARLDGVANYGVDMLKHVLVGLGAAFGLAGCVAVSPAEKMRLGDNPLITGGSYESGGGLTLAFDVRAVDGGTLICGVWAESERQSVLTRNAARQVLDSGAVVQGNVTLINGLAFMREIPPQDSYAGQPANCVMSSQALRGGPVRVSLPRQEVFRDEGDGSGGAAILFRQDGPAAHKNGFSLQGLLQDQIAGAGDDG